MLAAALGKFISGPPEKKPPLPQGQDSPSTGPNEALGPITAKPLCLMPSFWPLEE